MSTYAEFTASPEYKQALAGAQLGVRMVCREDPTKEIIGLADFSFNSQSEVLDIEEGGNEGVTELVMGRVRYSFQGSLFVRSSNIDNFMPTRATFLENQTWDIVVYDGARWPAAQDASPKVRVRYALRNCKFESNSFQHGASGDVRSSFSGKAVEFLSGVEYAALSGG